MPRKKLKLESCNGKPTAVETSEMKVINSVSENTRHRNSRKLKVVKEEDEAILRKEYRSCDKAGCPCKRPLCHVKIFEKCVGDGYTSRWYHVSENEHFCNECFEYFYRSYKDGYNTFCDWKKLWTSNTKMDPSIKAFIVDEIIPYWLKCTLCGKWRQLPANTDMTSDYISKFNCNVEARDRKKKANRCLVPEDKVVLNVKKSNWHLSLLYPPFLKQSPAANFLGPYFPEGVGLSPTCKQCIDANAAYQESRDKKQSKDENCTNNLNNATSDRIIPGLQANLHPFYQPDEPSKAWCLRPDVMEAYEVKEFPSYIKSQSTYLGPRNLIIALWNLNFKKWLTLETVSSHLICHGLVRVHCVELADKILRFYTRKGLINFGFVTPPDDFKLVPDDKKESIIVIGSGVSGLTAAHQLTRFGFDVTILEGNTRIGGRVWDDSSLEACIGRGAQIITGVVNNPLIILSEQAHLPYRVMLEKCDLYNFKGEMVDAEMDHEIDEHFNKTLENVANWKKDETVDVPLYDKVMEFSRTSCQDNGKTLSEAEKALLDFHIGNLEYACGSVLNNLSTLHWDQNEQFPQFAGEHAILPCGYSAILQRLVRNLDVRLNTMVSAIDYTTNQVKVTTTNGEYIADKVIVTIPLALLQHETIYFKPPLPGKKRIAIQSLGSGIIEKVALQFPCRFWDKKLIEADMFGYIPIKPSERGLFGVIYDMTPQNKRKENGPHILMTCATGDAVNLIEQNSDAETVDYFTTVLRNMFAKEEKVPDPINSFVTNWRKSLFAQMAYSYVKLGGSGESYDDLAESIDNKLFFAGEATNRQFPQTVTGAYISGLREADKITYSVLSEFVTKRRH